EAPASEPRLDQVGGHRGQPRTERLAAPELAQPADDTEESVVHDVFDVGHVALDAHRERKDVGGVAPVQGVEGAAVTHFDQRHQLGVVEVDQGGRYGVR